MMREVGGSDDRAIGRVQPLVWSLCLLGVENGDPHHYFSPFVSHEQNIYTALPAVVIGGRAIWLSHCNEPSLPPRDCHHMGKEETWSCRQACPRGKKTK